MKPLIYTKRELTGAEIMENMRKKVASMTSDELRPHAMVSRKNNEHCGRCFCCLALAELRRRSD